MGVVKVPLSFMRSKGEKVIYALFYSGATFSCINPENAGEMGVVEKMR